MTDERGPQPKTPELDRRSEVLPKAEVLTEFVDWLREQDILLAHWQRHEGGWTLAEPRLVPHGEPYERLFERYFGLDGDKIEAERRALLDWLAKAPKR